MVSYDGHSGPDMKFVNNSKTAVGIKTSFSDRKLTISIYGNPILEEGVTLSMKSEKVKELDPPAPTYEEDPTAARRGGGGQGGHSRKPLGDQPDH